MGQRTHSAPLPGCLVQAFHALSQLPSLDGICLLVTGDEETGSATSRALNEDIGTQLNSHSATVSSSPVYYR
ncbi:hypothetical protein [Streptomyces sp. NBC_01304]|uniref:hypothetical protein n=1 Tax=Streptomyces sp. NBC_01304 TaxID=2903818 RepID=UPI002E162C80